MFKKILVSSLLISVSIVVQAEVTTGETAEKASKIKWGGEAELGYLRTSGNTDTESLHAKGKVVNEREKWKHTGKVEVTEKSDSDITTAKRWHLNAKSDYKLNDRHYMFISLGYEDDDFSGYDYQTTEALGYGYHAIKKDDLKLDLELGAGARQSKLDTGASEDEVIVKGAADLDWKISETATFTQFLSVEAGEDNTISRSETGLKLQIVGNLSAKLSHTIKHSSDVPVGTENTDTESVVTLVYTF